MNGGQRQLVLCALRQLLVVEQEAGFVAGLVGNVEEEAVPEAGWFDGALLGGFFGVVVELQVVVAAGKVEVDFGGGLLVWLSCCFWWWVCPCCCCWDGGDDVGGGGGGGGATGGASGNSGVVSVAGAAASAEEEDDEDEGGAGRGLLLLPPSTQTSPSPPISSLRYSSRRIDW